MYSVYKEPQMFQHLIKIESAPDPVDQVLRSGLDAIRNSALAPGVRVMQKHIARLLAVSRQLVPQALQLLKKDGFFLDVSRRSQ